MANANDEPRDVPRRWYELHCELKDRVDTNTRDILAMNVKLDNNHSEQMTVLHRVEFQTQRTDRRQNLYAMIWLGVVIALFILVVIVRLK